MSKAVLKHLPQKRAWNEAAYRFVIHQVYIEQKIRYRLYFETKKGYGAWLLSRPPSLTPSDKTSAQIDRRYHPDFVEFEGPLDADHTHGMVLIWDRGSCRIAGKVHREENLKAFQQGVAEGRLEVYFEGEKLKGLFHLYRPRLKSKRWYFEKQRDRFASNSLYVFAEESVLSGIAMKEWLDFGIPKTIRPWNKIKKPMTLQRRKKLRRKVSPILASDADRKQTFLRIEKERRLGFRCGQLDKVVYPEAGFTKLDVLTYYYFIAPYMVPYLQDKAVVVHRYPFGVGEQSSVERTFKGVPPAWMRTICLFEEDHVKSEAHVFVDDERTLLYLANRSGLEFSCWSSSIGALDRPRSAVFALQPNHCSLGLLLEVARLLRNALLEFGLSSYCKTSGMGVGLHVCIPLNGLEEYSVVHEVLKNFAIWMMRRYPDKLSVIRQKSVGKVWLSLLGLGIGKAHIAPYSLRAHPEATISTPLFWEELESGIPALRFTLRNIFARLAEVGDPWRQMILDPPNNLRQARQFLQEKQQVPVPSRRQA